MNEEFPCSGCFDTVGYMEKCVLNEMCELPAGILDELDAVLGVVGKESKGTSSVQDDTSCVHEETVSSSEHDNKQAHGVDESRDGIGSIPTPSKSNKTRKRRNDGSDINKKPIQRPRVKKHRPKIYDDSKPKKVPKAQTPRGTPRPKTPKPATPNRVQERRTQSRKSTNRTQKSTSFGSEDVGQDVQEASRAIVVRSCKRLLDFDRHPVVKESKSHEQPPTLGFDFEKFDCFRHKIVTSKRNTPRRSTFQNKSLKASDNLVGDDNKEQNGQDICVTRNQAQVDKYGRKYVHFYQRRKKISSNSTNPVPTTPTLLVYRRSFRGNECLYNSRKCGPVFPKLFKKQRTMRNRVTIKVNQWYIIADELRKNLVKRSYRKLKQTTKKNVQNKVNKSKDKKAVVKSHIFTDEFLRLFSHTRRERSIMHTRFNENIAKFPYDLENYLLCQEENFLDITEHLPLHEVPVQRIKSYTSSYQDFPWFDNYLGNLNLNWLQLQEVAVYGSQSLPPQHQDILHTRKDLNEFNASEVEHLIGKMASMDINDQCKELVVRDHNVSGALVKIPPKKRKMIPKVDLDTETLRVWKLLMENDGSEPVEETDKDKEEWWETQRNIFRGRVDSFIAKMHLIQGNRRFSPWKGSVTDSVVGVYLTQNVSDHLSSSAFMSVAARFPAIYRSEEVNDDFEVPNSQESVASNTQICEGCSKNNEMEQVVSASYADVSDATPTVEPNQNPLQVQEKNKEMEQDMSASCADVSDVTPTMEPSQNSLQAQDKNNEMEQDMSDSYADVSVATPTVEPNQNPLQAQDKNDEMEQDMSASYADVSDATPTVESNQNPLQAEDKNNEMEHDVSASYADVSVATPTVEPNQNPLQVQDKDNEMEQDMSASHADVSDATPTVEPNQNPLPVQDKPCVDENSNTFRKFLEAEEANYLKQFCRDGIDESESSNEPSAITFDLNVSLCETSEGELIGQQKSTPVEEPKVTTPDLNVSLCETSEGEFMGQQKSTPVEEPKVAAPICSTQSKVTIERGVDSANNHKETPLVNEAKGKNKNKKEKKQIPKADWDELRKTYCKNGEKETNENYRDAVDWDAVRRAPAQEIAKIIEDRGMHNVIAGRIKEFLDRMYEDHDTLDLEWLRTVPPDTAKDFLLSIEGLGLKSVECVRLLTLHHNAFPVDTNVGRVATRLGWVPLQPLPNSVEIHLLNAYPMVDNIQKYLYPRLCTLDQKTLYELHYQLITFGKVFCTKIKPNCNACPMRAECRHYASAFASGRLALPGTKESSNVTSIVPAGNGENHSMGQPPSSFELEVNNPGSSYLDQSQTREPIIEVPPSHEENHSLHGQPPSSFDVEINNLGSSYQSQSQTCEPIIEVPPSPEPEAESIIGDIEDLWCESDDEIPTIRLNTEEFRETLKETMDINKTPIPDADVSKALIAFSAEAASTRVPPKKFIAKSRTMHLVYELPDFHPCLVEFEERDRDDPTPYLLAVWFPGEVPNSLEYTENRACVSANNNLEETVKATILIPCRTANRGSFPLNGTYFQVNEVFADDETSHVPMDVPRRLLRNLPLRELGCGSSATSIFKALSTGAIQRLFWRGSICVRGFNRKTRQPKHLNRKFHISTTALAAENRKSKNRENKLQ